MKTLLLLLASVAFTCAGHSAPASSTDKIPAELVGEWATAKSQFAHGAIVSGSAVYLTADGTAGLIGAPPPIGMRGTAVYDSSASTVTITLLDDENGGRPRQTMVLAYDARAKTLALASAKKAEDAFKRRSEQVPDFILKDIKAAKSGASR